MNIPTSLFEGRLSRVSLRNTKGDCLPGTASIYIYIYTFAFFLLEQGLSIVGEVGGLRRRRRRR